MSYREMMNVFEVKLDRLKRSLFSVMGKIHLQEKFQVTLINNLN